MSHRRHGGVSERSVAGRALLSPDKATTIGLGRLRLLLVGDDTYSRLLDCAYGRSPLAGRSRRLPSPSPSGGGSLFLVRFYSPIAAATSGQV